MSEKSIRPVPPAQGEETRTVTVTPPVDVLETDHELIVRADMPGVGREDVDIRFENGELTVHGRRADRHPDKARALWEYEVTNFARTFRVAEHIAADKIEAELSNGVLTLKLPKVEAVKPRRIAVKG